MSAHPCIILKPGKDVPVRAGHPWIFSEAIAKDVKTEPGALVEVRAHDRARLGIGTWNGNTSIRVRLLTRDANETINADFFARRLHALDDWKRARLPERTDGYRIVHAEADGLPGLILDRYASTFVFQLHTAGMDRLRANIIEAIRATFQPDVIVERSDLEVRRLEGLNDQPITVHAGSKAHLASFEETGLAFVADVLHGQKTGFFLDQREARQAVGKLAHGKRVLNLFGYSGAFSVHAATGGATFVTTVDASRSALELAEKNFALNGLPHDDEKRFLFLEANVFDMLRDDALSGAPYDLIICDPPALTKSARHLPQATKAYTDLNCACLEHLEPGGILITSSCSGRLDPDAFRSILRIAAGRAKRDVRVLDWIAQPIDHAERLAFPEGRYLKTAILEVTNRLP